MKTQSTPRVLAIGAIVVLLLSSLLVPASVFPVMAQESDEPISQGMIEAPPAVEEAGIPSTATCETDDPVGTGGSSRLLVLIEGLGSDTSQQELGLTGVAKIKKKWSYLIDTYTEYYPGTIRELYGSVLYFSFNPHSATSWTWEQSSDDVRNNRILLKLTLDACRSKGWTTFDIIGHSTGGVIAFEYAAGLLNGGNHDASVKHIITLDSPINGSFPYYCWYNTFSPICDSSTFQRVRETKRHPPCEVPRLRKEVLAGVQTLSYCYFGLCQLMLLVDYVIAHA